MSITSARQHARAVRNMIRCDDERFRKAIRAADAGKPPPKGVWRDYEQIRREYVARGINEELEHYGRVTLSSPSMAPVSPPTELGEAVLDAIRRTRPAVPKQPEQEV